MRRQGFPVQFNGVMRNLVFLALSGSLHYSPARAEVLYVRPDDGSPTAQYRWHDEVIRDEISVKSAIAVAKTANGSRPIEIRSLPFGYPFRERIRPDRLVQLLVDRETEVLVTARKHQGNRLIGEPAIEQGQIIRLRNSLASFEEDCPIAKEHVGCSIDQALHTGDVSAFCFA
jgi:hypothetical protein